MIGLLLSALNPFKMILFWGLKKIPLLLEIPTLKDHLNPERPKSVVLPNIPSAVSLVTGVVLLQVTFLADFA